VDEPSRIASILGELQALSASGYAMALHVQFTTPTYLFQTYPLEWSDHYSKAGLVMQDPTVAWAFENTGTIRWNELVGADTAGVLATAAEHGLAYGFTLSQDREGSRSLSSFSRGDRDFTDDEIAAIVSLADELHDLTTSGHSLPPATRDNLRAMSVRFTHP
jgi:LuxR family transcriptional regulator, quorum-sensing system regulator SdiA